MALYMEEIVFVTARTEKYAAICPRRIPKTEPMDPKMMPWSINSMITVF